VHKSVSKIIDTYNDMYWQVQIYHCYSLTYMISTFP